MYLQRSLHFKLHSHFLEVIRHSSRWKGKVHLQKKYKAFSTEKKGRLE